VWITNQQEINEGRIDRLSAAGCDKNLNYIDGVKNSRLLLSLLEYLRISLENY
jgi:hypothetical protein